VEIQSAGFAKVTAPTADRQTLMATVVAAGLTTGLADACDLQLYDSSTGTLRIAAHHGFTQDFLTSFATVDATQPTACASALATRQPVLIDDVTRSPIFVGHPTLDYLRAALTRAVRSYPLLTPHGAVYGVLSLHYHQPAPARGAPDLVAIAAAGALTHHP